MVNFFRFVFVFLIVFFARLGNAVELNVAADGGNRGITFTVSDAASTAGCSVQVYSSDSKRSLSNSRKRFSVAQGTGSGGTIIFKAATVPLIEASTGKQFKGKLTFQGFFRASLTCAGIQSNSAIVTERFLTAPDGMPFASWRIALRRKIKQADFQLIQAVPNLSFTRPLDVRSTNDGTRRLLVVEQGGLIYDVQPDVANPSKEIFLDLTSKTKALGERGLLGMALHPSFKDNGYVYVNYVSYPEGTTVIARYTATGLPSRATIESERILLTVPQTTPIHKGGSIAFGPDGYLYLGLGDGGPAGDPRGNAQNRAALYGKILRIDVDRTEFGKEYGIPLDNPFKGSLSHREEIFAWGFRNPFRFSFDSSTGRLWVGDVGQNKVEEVDIVEIGKNYGWNTMEASQCHKPKKDCNQKGLELPVYEYKHGDGFSITGGYVYRGSALPALLGKYIFGDFVAGKVWMLSYSKSKSKRDLLFDTDFYISSFGQDPDGELLLVSYGDGKIYKFAPR